MKWPFLGALLCLAACAAPHQITDRDDFLAEATRVYPGETRERVIRAAETVLKVSDPADWEFRDTLTGFTGLRRYTVYAVIVASQGREKWEFTTEETPPGLRAGLAISEAGTTYGNYSQTPYEGRMASIPLYRLFWDRVDYMLGRREDWVTCAAAEAEAAKTNTNQSSALGGLCGPTSGGRDAPPPEPLGPAPKPALPSKAKSA